MKKSVMFVMSAAAVAVLLSNPVAAYEAANPSLTAHVSVGTEVDKEIPLYDANNDGKLTTVDAMTILHNMYYPGGAAAGYDADHVWGVLGAFDYEITDKDGKKVQELSDGCKIKCTQIQMSADSYTLEWEGWNASNTTYTDGTTVTLTAVEHPANQGAPQKVANVGILVDGKDTGIRTDRNGRASIKLSGTGSHTVKGDFSAFSKTSGLNSFAYTVKPAEAPATTPAVTTSAAATTTTTAAPVTTTAAATTASAVSTTAAAATTTTTTATTAKAAATTTTKAATTAAQASTTKAVTTTKKADGSTQKVGSLQTGDALPVGGIATAGLLAIGTAIACACKRKDNH